MVTLVRELRAYFRPGGVSGGDGERDWKGLRTVSLLPAPFMQAIIKQNDRNNKKVQVSGFIRRNQSIL